MSDTAQGQSITNFIEAATDEHIQTVLAKQTLILTNAERDRFLSTLENPAVPTDVMHAGAERAMQSVRSGVLDA